MVRLLKVEQTYRPFMYHQFYYLFCHKNKYHLRAQLINLLIQKILKNLQGLPFSVAASSVASPFLAFSGAAAAESPSACSPFVIFSSAG